MEKIIENAIKILVSLSIFFIIMSILLWKSMFLLELTRPNMISAWYDRDPSLVIVLSNNLLFFIHWCFQTLYKQVYYKEKSRFWSSIYIVTLIINTILCLYYIYALYFYEVGMWYLF